MDVRLSTIGQVAVNVKDLPRAIAFYRDSLGMRFLFQAPPALAFFDCGEVRLLLDKAQDKEFDHPSSILYFKVPEIREGYESLKGKGVQFRKEPHVIANMGAYTLWMAFFMDTEGNTLALMSDVANPKV